MCIYISTLQFFYCFNRHSPSFTVPINTTKKKFYLIFYFFCRNNFINISTKRNYFRFSFTFLLLSCHSDIGILTAQCLFFSTDWHKFPVLMPPHPPRAVSAPAPRRSAACPCHLSRSQCQLLLRISHGASPSALRYTARSCCPQAADGRDCP